MLIAVNLHYIKFKFIFLGRAEALGKLGLAFSLGIMAGPMTGGVVAEKFGDRMVAFTASALSISSVIMVQLFLPKNTKSKIKKETAVSGTFYVYLIPMRSFTCN